ncbi:MAG: hypothetical protein Q7T57_02480 [Dehalococcoidales bacterium]|nr:hypothetical protein [Dehalococcoidales bacterium]
MKELKEMRKDQAEVRKDQAILKRHFEETRVALVLSDVGSDAFNQTIKRVFKIVTVSWPDALTQSLLTSPMSAAAPSPSSPPLAPAFAWSDEAENQQHVRYMQYLRDHLTLPPRGELQLIRPTNNTMLSVINDPKLPFDLKGTTDALVVHQGYLREYHPEMGIFLVIELKKVCDAKAVRQAIAQLIAADLQSQLTPFALLTDLREEWHFYWLEHRTVHALQPTGPTARRDALLFLRRVLASGASVGAELTASTTDVESLPVSIGRRCKLSPVKERRKSAEEEDASLDVFDIDEDDVDEPGWDAEDRKQVLFRQVRQMIRHTPWLQEVCRPSIFSPMSAEVSTMFG